jgi:hypothetical protein
MENKKCSKCNCDKPIEEFYKDKTRKDGYTSDCKICRCDSGKKYHEKNIEKRKLKRKIYYKNNKHKKQEYINKNKDEIKKRLNKSYLKNRDIRIKNSKEWAKNNPDKRKIYEARYHIKNPHIRACRDTLRHHLVRINSKKQGKTIDLLGYSAEELKNHIELLFTDGMTWENYGEWHIDHIIPICNFDTQTPPSIVNALNNLRPLWATTREINGVIYEGNLNRKKGISF